MDAYFIVDLKLVSFDNPSNTDAGGACCDVTEAAADACLTSCNISKYNVCIHPIGDSSADECPILHIMTSGGMFHVDQPWPVSHMIQRELSCDIHMICDRVQFRY